MGTTPPRVSKGTISVSMFTDVKVMDNGVPVFFNEVAGVLRWIRYSPSVP